MLKIVLLHKVAMTRFQEIHIGTRHPRGTQESDRAGIPGRSRKGFNFQENQESLNVTAQMCCEQKMNSEDLGKKQRSKVEKDWVKAKKDNRGLETF